MSLGKMEYKETYHVNRVMHVLPMCQLARRTREMCDQYQDKISIKIKGPSGREFDGRHIYFLLNGTSGIVYGSDVDIFVSGDFEEDVLKNCGDFIGEILTSSDCGERSTYEIKYEEYHS